MMRSTIRGSILSTSYLSSFWLIAYLLGKGVSIENIRAFMHLSASMLVRNADADARTGEGPPESLHGPLMAVAGRIARDLGSGDGSRTA
jgi:hypothetical protein